LVAIDAQRIDRRIWSANDAGLLAVQRDVMEAVVYLDVFGANAGDKKGFSRSNLLESPHDGASAVAVDCTAALNPMSVAVPVTSFLLVIGCGRPEMHEPRDRECIQQHG
jgi:hypothetical protein